MDAIVEAALKKWPHVPHCYGWLALDARGDWYMRDDRVQAAGPFPRVKGSRIEHDKLREFIERNYAADETGRWFFQNGPQRVYVEIEAAPLVWRIDARGADEAPGLTSHHGLPAAYRAAFVDEAGRLFIATDRGFGIVHTLDIEAAADAIESGRWQAETAVFAALPGRFAYRLSPAADQLP
ncbi:MAG: DUF2946 family protein [Caldimonas sp.]